MKIIVLLFNSCYNEIKEGRKSHLRNLKHLLKRRKHMILEKNKDFEGKNDTFLYKEIKELRSDARKMKEDLNKLLEERTTLGIKNRWGKYDDKIKEKNEEIELMREALCCQWLLIETYQKEINYRKYNKG